MTWAHSRRLRRRSAKRPLTYLQAVHAKRQLLASINLLDWLRSQEKTLADCTQSDIDNWLDVGKTEASSARIFVAWCVERQHAQDIEVPACERSDGDIDQVEPDERWGLSRRLLHDSTIPTVERVAGSLLLLHGQPAAWIVAMTTAQVTTSSDSGIQLILGT